MEILNGGDVWGGHRAPNFYADVLDMTGHTYFDAVIIGAHSDYSVAACRLPSSTTLYVLCYSLTRLF